MQYDRGDFLKRAGQFGVGISVGVWGLSYQGEVRRKRRHTLYPPPCTAIGLMAQANVLIQGQQEQPYWHWDGINLALGTPVQDNRWQGANSNSTFSNGVDPNYIFNVSDGAGGQCTRMKTTCTQFQANHGEQTSMWLGSGSQVGQHTTQGEETWYRQRVRFPSGFLNFIVGNWNMVGEWHSDSTTAHTSHNCGVKCDGTYPGAGTNPRLSFEYRAGQIDGSGNAQYDLIIAEMASNSLILDHWYEILYRFKWEYDNTGIFEWWVDGVQIYQNQAIPTLMRTNAGHVDVPGFGSYNYRSSQTITSHHVDHGGAWIGPTRASVGG